MEGVIEHAREPMSTGAHDMNNSGLDSTEVGLSSSLPQSTLHTTDTNDTKPPTGDIVVPLRVPQLDTTHNNHHLEPPQPETEAQTKYPKDPVENASDPTGRNATMDYLDVSMRNNMEQSRDSPNMAVSPDTKHSGEPASDATKGKLQSHDISLADGTIPPDVPGQAATKVVTSIHESVNTEQSRFNTRPDHTVVRLVERAESSAGKLVNLLAKHIPSLRDECRFEGRTVRFLKRAQILVADLWAAFGGTGWGEFHDIDHLTMFAGRQGVLV